MHTAIVTNSPNLPEALPVETVRSDPAWNEPGAPTSVVARSGAAEIALALSVVALATLCSLAHRAYGAEYERGSLEALMRGEAWTPYQYRMLVPWIVAALHDGLHVPASPRDIATVLEIVMWVVLFYVQRALTRTFVRDERLVLVGSLAVFPVLALQYLLPPSFYYVYDVPSVALFTLGVLLIQRGRFGLLYPVFALGELNRELIRFLIPLLLATWRDRLRPPALAGHVAGLSALWIALRALLSWHYADSPGGGQYDIQSIPANLGVLADPSAWPTLAASFGGLWLVVLIDRRRIGPTFVRRALWIVPLWFVVMLRFAAVDELRIYGELAPLVLLAAVCAFDGRLHARKLRD
jgi:hypothetical protein